MSYPDSEALGQALPVIESSISTGFPSPCEQFSMSSLNIDEFLITHPSASMFSLVQSTELEDTGIYKGDLAMVDKSLLPKAGDIVLALADEGWAYCRFEELERSLNQGVEIKGVVPYSVRLHRPLLNGFIPDDETLVNLNDLLIHEKNRDATFLAWANGRSLEGIGIFDGDLLMIDRKISYINGDVVIANVDREFTCKILDKVNWTLRPSSSVAYPSFELSGESELAGVVTYSIRMHRPPCSK